MVRCGEAPVLGDEEADRIDHGLEGEIAGTSRSVSSSRRRRGPARHPASPGACGRPGPGAICLIGLRRVLAAAAAAEAGCRELAGAERREAPACRAQARASCPRGQGFAAPLRVICAGGSACCR